MEGVRSFGHSWTEISAQIPGRPPLTCRNRWRVVSKKSDVQVAVSKEGNPSRTTTASTAPDSVRSQSVTDIAAVSQSTEFASGSGAAGTTESDSSNLEIDSDPSASSCSPAAEEDAGTNTTLGDMSHAFDSFLQEFYDSQNTSVMLPHLSNTTDQLGDSPDPANLLNQMFSGSMRLDSHIFGPNRSAERRAEQEAEATERRQDTGAAQTISEDNARSDRSKARSGLHQEQADIIENSLTEFPPTILSSDVASIRDPLAGEVHH